MASCKGDRFLNESRLFKGDAQFQLQSARKASLGKKQIAAAGAAANSQILRSGFERVESLRDRFGCNRLLVRREARIFAIRRVNHMSTKKKNLPWHPSRLGAYRTRQCPVYNFQTGLNLDGSKTKILINEKLLTRRIQLEPILICDGDGTLQGLFNNFLLI